MIAEPGPARETAESSPTGAGREGMAERAALFGGWLTARPEAGGFSVKAALPVKLE